MKKILIIDDDEEFSFELGELLKEENYTVDITNEVEKGLEILTKKVYEVVLLDYKMPKLNGIEFLKEIKKIAISTKFILITGSLNIDKLIETENVNDLVICVIKKPFEVSDLLMKIRSCELR